MKYVLSLLLLSSCSNESFNCIVDGADSRVVKDENLLCSKFEQSRSLASKTDSEPKLSDFAKKREALNLGTSTDGTPNISPDEKCNESNCKQVKVECSQNSDGIQCYSESVSKCDMNYPIEILAEFVGGHNVTDFTEGEFLAVFGVKMTTNISNLERSKVLVCVPKK